MHFCIGEKSLPGKPHDILQIIKITFQSILNISPINYIISIESYYYDCISLTGTFKKLFKS